MLIKSSLASLPIHLLSLFTVPVSIVEKMEEIMRNFLWGTTNEKKRYHLLSWEQVCLPKEWGGLSLRRIVDINKALLCKWVWRLGDDDNELWKRTIKAKYGWSDQWGRLTTRTLQTHGVAVWKSI